METHKLIDPEDPKCIFCKSPCFVSGAGWSPDYFIDKYECINKQCREEFAVHRKKDKPPYAFDFTCGPLMVVHHYDTNYLVLRRWTDITTESATDNPIGIPYFDMDFTDKEALIRKLQTYMLFA